MGVVLNLDLEDKRIFIIPTKNVLFPKYKTTISPAWTMQKQKQGRKVNNESFACIGR